MKGTRDGVRELLEEGLPLNEIARRLGVAGPTVAYHAARLRDPIRADEPEPPSAAPTARKKVATREQVAALLAEGVGHLEIARRLGVTKSTVTYHARRLGAAVDERCARRYDWKEIQCYYDSGRSVRECQARFGFSRETWHAAVRRGAVAARPAALPLNELLVANTYRGRTNLKVRLIREGVKLPRCESCGLSHWRGKAVSFALHHINGDRLDNTLENLELLCPNCHSQTDNFAGRNGRKQPPSRSTSNSGGHAQR